jgi:CBS domain containing-hemolysin-like protein
MNHLWIIALLLLAAGTFLALISNSLRRYSIARLEDRLRELGRPDRLVRFLEIEDSLIQMASAWRLLVNTAFVFIIAFLMRNLPPAHAVALALGAAAALIAFGSAIPLAWSRFSSESIIARSISLLLFCRTLSWPLLAVMRLFDHIVRRLAGAADESPHSRQTELADQIRSFVREGEMEGAFQPREKQMIESIIEFRNTTVSQIMTPRTDVLALAREANLEDARRFIADSGHSRIPVFQGTLDVVVGVLYAKDVLAAVTPGFQTRSVADIFHPALFIPETKNLTDLLRDFQRTGMHMAIVLDEYGGTAGLVTIEDIIEEILGEIADEFDESRHDEIHKVSDTVFELDARTRIPVVNAALRIQLPENQDYETVGGFVLARLGYIPKVGEKIDYRGLIITILQGDERRVDRLRIEALDQFLPEAHQP